MAAAHIEFQQLGIDGCITVRSRTDTVGGRGRVVRKLVDSCRASGSVGGGGALRVRGRTLGPAVERMGVRHFWGVVWTKNTILTLLLCYTKG